MNLAWASTAACPYLVVMLSLLLAATSVLAQASSPLFDDSKDEIVAHTFVPSPDQRVGEVRLIRRGSADVVQTLLYSKILKRVVGEIRKKEERNWPPSVDGHVDAETYMDALSKAQADIWNRLPKFEHGADQRQKLMIEFVLSKDDALLQLAEFDMSENGGEVHVVERRQLALLRLSRGYIQKNMRLIAADSFAIDGDKLDALLKPLDLLRRR